MLDQPPTLETQSARINATLTTWVTSRGGLVKQIANASHIWEEVPGDSLADSRPRVLFWFESENSKGGQDRRNKMHRVYRSWRVVLMRGHGWANLVATGDANQPESFLSAISSLRETIRLQDDVTEAPPVDYERLESLPNIAPGKASNIFLDSFQLRFTTENDLAAINTNPL